MLYGPVFLHILPPSVRRKFVTAFKVNESKSRRSCLVFEFNSQRHRKAKNTLFFLKRGNDIYFLCAFMCECYSFLILINACCVQSSFSLLFRFQTKSMQCQVEEKLPEESKFGTSGRYHFELRSLTSCLAVKFITFTFKKSPRYTSVSFVFFFVAVLCYVQLHRIGCCFVIGCWENFLVTSDRASGEMWRRNLSFTDASSYHV